MTDALQNAQVRGSQAEALLRSELLQEAFTELEAEYTKALFLTRPEHAQARESLYLAVNVVRKVKDHLERMVSDGKIAKTEIDDIAGRKKRFGIV